MNFQLIVSLFFLKLEVTQKTAWRKLCFFYPWFLLSEGSEPFCLKHKICTVREANGSIRPHRMFFLPHFLSLFSPMRFTAKKRYLELLNSILFAVKMSCISNICISSVHKCKRAEKYIYCLDAFFSIWFVNFINRTKTKVCKLVIFFSLLIKINLSKVLFIRTVQQRRNICVYAWISNQPHGCIKMLNWVLLI